MIEQRTVGYDEVLFQSILKLMSEGERVDEIILPNTEIYSKHGITILQVWRVRNGEMSKKPPETWYSFKLRFMCHDPGV